MSKIETLLWSIKTCTCQKWRHRKMFEMLVTFNADINSKFVCLEFCKNFTFMLQIFIYTENVQNRLLPIPYHQQSLYSNKKRIHSKIEHIHSSVY